MVPSSSSRYTPHQSLIRGTDRRATLVRISCSSSDEARIRAASARKRCPSPIRSRACSARRRLVMSRKTSTTPVISPSGFRIGAPLSSIGTSAPCRVIRTVRVLSPAEAPRSKSLVDRALDRLTGRLVDNLEDLLDGTAIRFLLAPAGDLDRGGVHENHSPPGVGHQDGVPDARKGHLQPFLPFHAKPDLRKRYAM